MEYYRNEVTNLASSWIGLKESDGSYKKIIDIYNSMKTFPRGVRMQYGWAWCACTWSALAVKLGYTKIMPVEISCPELIKKAKEMGIWKENDGYVPKPADAVLYDWQDNGIGDNTGEPDHIGIVESINKDSGYFVVIEGNYQDAVKRRTVSINGRYIRGFITPKYTKNKKPSTDSDAKKDSKKDPHKVAHEIIAGGWGSGNNRKKLLENAGYNYDEVQGIVNKILNGGVCKNCKKNTFEQSIERKVKATTFPKKCQATKYGGFYITSSDLYCRNDVGTNKKALCLIPKGTEVFCNGYYGVDSNKNEWFWITVRLDGVEYTGFSCAAYLKRH